MRLLPAHYAGRGLVGFGHLPQYPAIKSASGFSYHRDVPNRFTGFERFAEPVNEECAEKQTKRASNQKPSQKCFSGSRSFSTDIKKAPGTGLWPLKKVFLLRSIYEMSTKGVRRSEEHTSELQSHHDLV